MVKTDTESNVDETTVSSIGGSSANQDATAVHSTRLMLLRASKISMFSCLYAKIRL